MIYSPRLGLAAAILSGIIWQPVRSGMERATFTMGTTGGLAHVRVTALRINPCRIKLSLDTRTRDAGMRGAWTVDSIPKSAVLALNGGQFVGPLPWGWFVRDGVERQPPGVGPLSMALTIDSLGRVALLTESEIAQHRGSVLEAIQSYPTLLVDGRMPAQLQPGQQVINLSHHDTRLGIGVAADGAVIIAITRFGGSGGAGGTIPYGPTIPQLAELMQRLGAVRALGLDGGLSSQLAWRNERGVLTSMTNWRLVPLGIIGTARSGCSH